MDQPTIGAPNQSDKTCWSCTSTSTRYNVGFCSDCWFSLPQTYQQIYSSVCETEGPAQFVNGRIRLAIADLARQLRFPPQPKAAPPASGLKLNLEDLDL